MLHLLHQWRPFLLLLLLLLLSFTSTPYGDVLVGTAVRYPPPYLPTACFGRDASQLPPSNFFGAAGAVIWDKGASCGRRYSVKCISSRPPSACVPDQTIRVTIVDFSDNNQTTNRARVAGGGTTMLLSEAAYSAIASTSATLLNIEYQPL